MKVAFFVGVKAHFKVAFYMLVKEILGIFLEKTNFILEKLQVNENANDLNFVETNRSNV